MSEAVKPPTIVPWKINHMKNTRQVVVICPHCGEKHFHGWPYDMKDIGHRTADCTGTFNPRTGETTPPPSNNGYFIVPPANYKKQPPSKT